MQFAKRLGMRQSSAALQPRGDGREDIFWDSGSRSTGSLGIGSEGLHCFDPMHSFATVLPMKQLFIAALAAITATPAPAIWPEKNPTQAVRNFYAWYVHEVATGSRPLEKERELMRKFVTDRLLSRIDKMPKGP